MLASLITLLVVGLVGMVLLGVVLAVVGVFVSVALAVAGVLLFKVAPLLLVGWLILKLVQRGKGHRQISAADQRWLDS
jgi:hypothetical protein